MEVDDTWPWKILWSDEVHFYLDGAVNTQNCRTWGTSPPNILYQKPLHSDYVTALCGFTVEFILVPFFFETLTPQDALSRVHGTINFFNNSGGIRTLPDLKASIIHHLTEIPRELLRATIESVIMRFQHVIDINGALIDHIL
ncbi:uncharacterized protein TNCV_3283781 [Trichonephila clavipes]|nr:uncharacterized protein TNCV_3283781 [Trichonephila clavipes]